MPRVTLSSLTIFAFAGVAACASAGTSASSAASMAAPHGRAETSNEASTPRSELPCTDCEAIPMPTDVTHAVETRIAALKALGGDCSRYGAVLESSYRSGQIVIRPFMWRVGAYLASGEAKPNGDMTLAREIDSLNVGVRTVDDVVSSMEHEAVHITFDIASGIDASEAKANQIVRACKG